jgi:hypothetical protein
VQSRPRWISLRRHAKVRLLHGHGRRHAGAYNSTTFTKAGRFEHDSGSGANATFDTGGGFATHSSREVKGTYAVKDGYISLTDEEGKPFRRWTVLLSEGTDDKDKPKTYILVDGDYID